MRNEAAAMLSDASKLIGQAAALHAGQGLRHTELHNILFAESPVYTRWPKPLHGSDLRECSEDDDKLPN